MLPTSAAIVGISTCIVALLSAPSIGYRLLANSGTEVTFNLQKFVLCGPWHYKCEHEVSSLVSLSASVFTVSRFFVYPFILSTGSSTHWFDSCCPKQCPGCWSTRHSQECLWSLLRARPIPQVLKPDLFFNLCHIGLTSSTESIIRGIGSDGVWHLTVFERLDFQIDNHFQLCWCQCCFMSVCKQLDFVIWVVGIVVVPNLFSNYWNSTAQGTQSTIHAFSIVVVPCLFANDATCVMLVLTTFHTAKLCCNITAKSMA